MSIQGIKTSMNNGYTSLKTGVRRAYDGAKNLKNSTADVIKNNPKQAGVIALGGAGVLLAAAGVKKFIEHRQNKKIENAVMMYAMYTQSMLAQAELAQTTQTVRNCDLECRDAQHEMAQARANKN